MLKYMKLSRLLEWVKVFVHVGIFYSKTSLGVGVHDTVGRVGLCYTTKY